MNIQITSPWVVTARLKKTQRQGINYHLTFRGKKLIVNKPEVKFYAISKSDAFKSLNPDELDFFKLEIDLQTKNPFYDDYTSGEETISVASADPT